MRSDVRSNQKTGFARVRLSALIALALSAPLANAQDAIKPGLYTTVDEKAIYIIRGGQQIDVKTGETVTITADGLQFVDSPPSFLSWPCGTSFAGNRGNVASFPASELPPGDEIATVAQRFFENAEILEGNPSWLNGESHMTLSLDQIAQFISNAYWYKGGPPDAKMAAQRPQTLIIGLFYGTGQVIVDTNQLAALEEKYGDQNIPVLFQYQEEDVVPISYFGVNPSPGLIMRSFQEKGIKPAEVPMWYAGDKHVEVAPEVLASFAGVPPAGQMDADRLARIQRDLASNAFSGKPITLAMTQGGAPLLDEPERLRAAQQAGVSAVPVMFSAYDSGSHSSFCGLAPPVAAAGALGEFSDDPEATPVEEGPGPQLPEDPQIPPEIALPNPPQPELPPPPEPELPPPPPPEPPASDN